MCIIRRTPPPAPPQRSFSFTQIRHEKSSCSVIHPPVVAHEGSANQSQLFIAQPSSALRCFISRPSSFSWRPHISPLDTRTNGQRDCSSALPHARSLERSASAASATVCKARHLHRTFQRHHGHGLEHVRRCCLSELIAFNCPAARERCCRVRARPKNCCTGLCRRVNRTGKRLTLRAQIGRLSPPFSDGPSREYGPKVRLVPFLRRHNRVVVTFASRLRWHRHQLSRPVLYYARFLHAFTLFISLGSSRSGRLLVSGDDFGCVKVRASCCAPARVAPRLRRPFRFFAFLPSPAAKNFVEISGTARTSCEPHHVTHHTRTRVHYGVSYMPPACLSHRWPGVFGSLQLTSAFAVMLAHGCSLTARAGMSSASAATTALCSSGELLKILPIQTHFKIFFTWRTDARQGFLHALMPKFCFHTS